MSGRKEGQKRREEGRYSPLYCSDSNSKGMGRHWKYLSRRKTCYDLSCERPALGAGWRIIYREQEKKQRVWLED